MVKCEVLGGSSGELSEIRVLNRVIMRDAQGITLEADPRHAETVVRDLGSEGATPSKLPGSKEEHKRAGGGPAGVGEYPLLSLGKGRGENTPRLVHGAADENGVALADASPQRGTKPGGVHGGQEDPEVSAHPQCGSKPEGKSAARDL